ncbi:transmembrane protein, putative, partial [Bodo saltans]
RYFSPGPLGTVIVRPMPLLYFYDVINCSITCQDCRFVVIQIEDPYPTLLPTSPAALFLGADGALVSSQVSLANFSVTVIQNSSFPLLNTTLLNFTTLNSSSTLRITAQSMFTNLRAIMTTPTTVPTDNGGTISVSVDCGSRWCRASPAAVTAVCSFVALVDHLTDVKGSNTSLAVHSSSSSLWFRWTACTPSETSSRSLEQLSFSETSSNDPAASVSRNKSATIGLYSTTRRLTQTRTVVIARSSLSNVVPSSAQAVVVYASLAASTGSLGAMARGAVPALQRSSAVALLASLCDASSDNSNEMFTSFGDNPFGLHLSIDDGDHFGNAAGAAVGNMLMVVIVSVASHAIGKGVTCALGRTGKRGSARLAVRIIDALLPSSSIPGAVALPYGTLVQPSVAACHTGHQRWWWRHRCSRCCDDACLAERSELLCLANSAQMPCRGSIVRKHFSSGIRPPQRADSLATRQQPSCT